MVSGKWCPVNGGLEEGWESSLSPSVLLFLIKNIEVEKKIIFSIGSVNF